MKLTKTLNNIKLTNKGIFFNNGLFILNYKLFKILKKTIPKQYLQCSEL